MPYRPDEARAILASYHERGEQVPPHVMTEIRKALRGKGKKAKPGALTHKMSRR